LGAYKYKAFISYSHKDERWARWLHRRLENYPVPPHLTDYQTSSAETPKRLKPIFRDREELAAADSLGEKIEQALADSENLIIICSPHAAQSHWVNKEVIFFKRQNRGAKIFSLIVDGEPFASKISGREKEECFPATLRFNVDADGNLTKNPAEPLAADIRAQGDGKRLGLLKLVSGMIGVGLDEIVQRDMRRGRKRVMAITATSLAMVLVMGTLTGFALSARKDAEARRNDAEENIEFMITDLKKALEPVGRLSAMKVVGERAEAYYDKYPISKHNDEALGRRARVFHYLGEILDSEGYLGDSDRYFKRAYAATEALLARDPDSANRIFEHAQSVYYVGRMFLRDKKLDLAKPFFEEYVELSEKLNELEPTFLRSLQELTYAYTNLGIFFHKQGQADKADEAYLKALSGHLKIASEFPNNEHLLHLANAYAWLADSAVKRDNYKQAIYYRKSQQEIFKNLDNSSNEDLTIEAMYLSALVGLARTEFLSGNVDNAIRNTNYGLPKSFKLWQKDKSNTKWLQNYALFCLLNAEIEFFRSNYFAMQISIDEYDSLKNQALRKSSRNKFFKTHEKRRKILIPTKYVAQSNEKENLK